MEIEIEIERERERESFSRQLLVAHAHVGQIKSMKRFSLRRPTTALLPLPQLNEV